MTTSASSKHPRVLFVTEWDRVGIDVDHRLAGLAVYRHSQEDYLGLVPERRRTRCGLLHVGA